MIMLAQITLPTDPTDDWNSVTRQLRMYAVGSKARHVLAIDAGVGIYFQFPPDPGSDDEPYLYLYAATHLGQSFDGELRLSLRELVVYALSTATISNSAISPHTLPLRSSSA